MESVSNGEVLGTGHKHPPADSESQSLSPDVVKAFKNKGTADLIKTDDDKELLLNDSYEPQSNSNVETPDTPAIDTVKTDDKEVLLNDSSEPNSNVESSSTTEVLSNAKSKENGISDAEKHTESEAVVSSSPDTVGTDDVNRELENNSSGQSQTVENEQCHNEIDQEQTHELEENDHDTSSPSNSIADKENAPDEVNTEVDLPSSPDIKGTDNCNDAQHATSPSSIVPTEEKVCQEDTKSSPPPSVDKEDESMDCSDIVDSDKASIPETVTMDKNDSSVHSTDEPDKMLLEVSKNEDKSDGPPLAENDHSVTTESVESSQDDKAKVDSSIDSDVINNEKSVEEEPMDCDEQSVEIIDTNKSEQSTENKSESSPNSVEIDKPHETDLKEAGESLTNSQIKSEEHLLDSNNKTNAVPNHEEKNVPSPCEDSESEAKTSSLSISDKENKTSDSLTLQERLTKEPTNTFVFAELTNEETGFPDAFTGLVKIGKYISVKGDFTLRSSEALVESPSLTAPYLLKEPDTFPPKDKDANKSELKDFFHSAAGEILIGIGLSRVNEWFHKDMVRIKKRQIKRKGTPELEKDLEVHEKFYDEAKKANNVYSFDFHSCKTCGFTTESSIVMEGHLLIPHLTQRKEFQCNFCEIIKKDAKEMIEHMKLVHRKVGRIEPPILFFECIYCAFESNSKVKLNHHLLKCQRVYDPNANQAPGKDFEFPALTPKPITVAVVKAYEKSLGSMQKGRGRPKKDLSDPMHHMNQFAPNSGPALGHMPLYRGSSNTPLADSLMQNQMLSGMLRTAHAASMLRPGMQHMTPPNRYFGQMMPMMGNNHMANSPFSQNLDVSKKSASSIYNKLFENKNPSSKAPSLTITPLPKLTGPYPVAMAKPSSSVQSGAQPPNAGSLVVCEICDGYIKDLEQLRTHMQLIHKVKIHPKMLVSRPPLNCQKCQWRFFTDQGLERHLLGAHGLVTSNMQEMANKGKDAGCCTICGRVYASKLVSHMNQVHKISLKPAHLSYKCTVCSATFNLYRLFENHVYLVHSGAGKRSADGRSSPSAKKLKSSEEGDAKNHKDKDTTSEDVVDENAKKCKECGCDVGKDSEDTCEKCLGSDELVEEGAVSAKTIKDELKHKGKAIEKAAA